MNGIAISIDKADIIRWNIANSNCWSIKLLFSSIILGQKVHNRLKEWLNDLLVILMAKSSIFFTKPNKVKKALEFLLLRIIDGGNGTSIINALNLFYINYYLGLTLFFQIGQYIEQVFY